MKSITILLSVVLVVICGCVQRQLPPQAGHIFILKSSAGEPQFDINLPSDYAMHHHEGPDFDVYYFSDASGKSRVGIYVGRWPSLQSKQAGVTQIQHVPGRVGKSSVEWLRWIQDGEHHSETLVQGLSDGLVLHVFATAATEKEVASLETTASTLRLKSAK
jgi:hypothetical protein